MRGGHQSRVGAKNVCFVHHGNQGLTWTTVFRGEHVRYPEVETFTARSIKITSDQPKILAPDGELVGTTPAEVTCLHQALDVFC